VQGQLRDESLSFTLESACAQSGRSIQIEIDGELNYRVLRGDAEPLLFVPLVDVDRLKDPSIIDAF
jgi:hypothetical protein